MLVLTRKLNECIVIGEGANKVEVYVVKLNAKSVKLGINADPNIPIYRSETGREVYGNGNPVPRNNPPDGLEGNVQLNEPRGLE